MRGLTSEEAKEYLASVNLKIGSWGQLCDISERKFEVSEWMNHAAPIEAMPLYCYSHRVLRWLDLRAWAIVQMDDSTNLAADEDFLVSRLMFGPEARSVLLESRSFLFECDESAAPRERWLLGDVLHLMLLFGAHCQVVSAGSMQGKHLSVQDGYVYFLSRDSRDLARAAEILRHIEEAPLEIPSDV